MKDGMTRQSVIGRFGYLLSLLASAAFLLAIPGRATVAYADCTDYSILIGPDESAFCEDLLVFFNNSVGCDIDDPNCSLLKGTGNGDTPAETRAIRKNRIRLMRELLKRACELMAIDPDFHDVAAILLQTAYDRCDGDGSIKDWVRGPAKEELACRLQAFIKPPQDAQPSE